MRRRNERIDRIEMTAALRPNGDRLARLEAREQELRSFVEVHQSAREIDRLTGVSLEVRQ